MDTPLKKIGKYKITGRLGSGAQGVVLLGIDPTLQREVAIKVLHRNANAKANLQLINEAKIVSKFRHANVVTLLDFGNVGAKPYLVFERLEGQSLREELSAKGSLGLQRSVILMSQILGGVDTAHKVGIAHCDLSPNNIVLTHDDRPMVMDFGLSAMIADHCGSGSGIAGTPAYMSPEQVRGHPPGMQSDVFALGLMFFEMLTGQRYYGNKSNIAEIFDAILHGEPRSLSKTDPTLPRLLDIIIETAMQKDRAKRYPAASAMKKDLDKYRIPRDANPQERHSTVDFLLRRLRHAPGFSAFSERIQDVLTITTNANTGDAGRIAGLLVRDVTLTQRVLTMANSAMNPGAKITNLSRAVAWLGMDQVRDCVASCLLSSELRHGSEHIKLLQVSSFYCALINRACINSLGIAGKEDAFLAGMFHHLGKMLVIHYFANDYEEIVNRSGDRDSEITHCRDVLGLPYHEIGQQVAISWQLPETIVQAMRPLPRGDALISLNAQIGIPHTTAYCAALCETVINDQRCGTNELEPLINTASDRVQLGPDVVLDHMVAAIDMTTKYAATIGARGAGVEFCASVEARLEGDSNFSQSA
ncbi:MAG: HDOD domain-containing protein [Pseudomonadota bacterium]